MVPKTIDHDFIVGQINNYYRRDGIQVVQDNALIAIGLHTGLLKKEDIALRSITTGERRMVLFFIERFLVARCLSL